jgi:ABC-type Fe3+ transport system permease subunit
MIENRHNDNIKTEIGSEKNFGIVFSIVFLLISLYPLINSEDILIWSIILSCLFIMLAYLLPRTLTLPNKLWFKFGLMLGSIIAPVVMALVYFTSVVPLGIIFKILGKDPMQRKLDKSSKSYWISKEQPNSSMKDQF